MKLVDFTRVSKGKDWNLATYFQEQCCDFLLWLGASMHVHNVAKFKHYEEHY